MKATHADLNIEDFALPAEALDQIVTGAQKFIGVLPDPEDDETLTPKVDS